MPRFCLLRFVKRRATRCLLFLPVSVFLFTLTPLLLSGCGGGGGNGAASSTAVNRFVGTYTGQVALPQSRIGRYILQCLENGNANGEMEITDTTNGGNTPLARAVLQGIVNRDNGLLTISGSFEDSRSIVPITITGALPEASQTDTRSLTVSVDNVRYTGSVAVGTSYPSPPSSTAGSGEGTFRYAVNGSVVSGTRVEGLVYENHVGVIRLSTDDLSTGSIMIVFPAFRVGTYSVNNNDGTQAFYYPNDTPDLYYGTSYGGGINQIGSFTITSVSDGIVQGTFSFRGLVSDTSNRTVEISSGTFSVPFTAAPVSP